MIDMRSVFVILFLLESCTIPRSPLKDSLQSVVKEEIIYNEINKDTCNYLELPSSRFIYNLNDFNISGIYTSHLNSTNNILELDSDFGFKIYKKIIEPWDGSRLIELNKGTWSKNNCILILNKELSAHLRMEVIVYENIIFLIPQKDKEEFYLNVSRHLNEEDKETKFIMLLESFLRFYKKNM